MTVPAGLVGVTGATGGLGGRVAARLAAQGVPLRLIVRDASRAPDLPGAQVAQAAYGDAQAMQAALDGVSTLLLVSASESADRIREHTTAVDAVARAGVGRLVYTSFYGAAPDATFTLARHHWATEERIRSHRLDATLLRDNLYLDVLPMYVGKDGVIRGPAGDGRFAGVSRDDIADCAVAVLLGQASGDGDGDGDGDHSGQTFDLTGPAALSLAEAAEQMSRSSGREIRYVAETVPEAYASRAHYGAPEWMVDGWVSTYTAIAAGELSRVTDHVRRLTGHEPMSFAEYLESDPAALSRLRR
jgi:NAD(P)H dehydrogenase (quinone)